MKLGLDVRMWHNTGIGRYIRALVRELPAFGVSLTVWGPQEILVLPALSGCDKRQCEAPLHSIAEQWQLSREIPRAGVDLFHSPHFNLPLFGRFVRVVTIHDLIPLRFPATLSGPRRWYFRQMTTRFAPAVARLVITVSEHSRRDLIDHGVAPERVVAISHGVDSQFQKPLTEDKVRAHLGRLGIRPPYILYAGQHKPYKNLETLLRAFAHLQRSLDGTRPQPSLVLLGRSDPSASVVGLARRLGVAERLVIPGYLEQEEAVVALYQGARCFAFPTRCEGFGLPPLEAMAAGTPVVCSNEAILKESVGDQGIQVQPEDVVGWSQAIEQALWDEDRRLALISAGKAHAAKFSWSESARRTAELYQEAYVRL